MTMRASPVVQILKAPPSLKGISEKGQATLSSGKSPSTVIAATAFSIADLQVATNSFAQENLIGEGSLGRVYRGDFPDGQVRSTIHPLCVGFQVLCGQDGSSILRLFGNFCQHACPERFCCAGSCGEEARYICCSSAR